MKEAAIIGVGQTAFVRGYEGSIRELAFDAYREAMLDTGLTPREIEASIICSAPEYDKQRTPAGTIAETNTAPDLPTSAALNLAVALRENLLSGL